MPRPVQHPAAQDISIAAVLYALSDPVRAAIVRELTKAPTGLNCTEMNSRLGLKLAKSSCSQHFRILREAGVIFSERKGVELFSRVRTQELSAKFPGLLRSILKGYEP
jgi:DNA-binding transcriptional ArsR family regulator